MSEETAILPVERIEQCILLIRGHKVMLDSDLAKLYGVETKALNQAVKRNSARFPLDFMFRLTTEEVKILQSNLNVFPQNTPLSSRSQSVTLKRGQNIKYKPYVFTEQGVAMLSSVLKSEQAIKVNVEIMRTFVRLRQLLSSNKNLARRLDELEKKYDTQFRIVFDAIRELMAPTEPTSKRRIGIRQTQ